MQAEELKNEMLQKGFNIEVVKADVSNRNEVNSLIEFAIKNSKNWYISKQCGNISWGIIYRCFRRNVAEDNKC